MASVDSDAILVKSAAVMGSSLGRIMPDLSFDMTKVIVDWRAPSTLRSTFVFGTSCSGSFGGGCGTAFSGAGVLGDTFAGDSDDLAADFVGEALALTAALLRRLGRSAAPGQGQDRRRALGKQP